MPNPFASAFGADKRQPSNLPTPPQETPPPVYPSQPSNLPLTPPPDITAAFANLTLEPSSFPSPDQCLAHLKLLEAVHTLREDISNRDGVFQIWDRFAKHQHDPPKARTAICEKRWEIYVAKAVQRFEKWWTVCVEKDAKRLEYKQIPEVFQKFEDEQNEKITSDLPFTDLPPLDVIMVWHAYQLNPRAFLEDCLRFGKMKFWRAGFPWEKISAAIDNETFGMKSEKLVETMWKFNTGFEWDSLKDKATTEIRCPQCKQPFRVPWTRWTRNDAFSIENDRFLGKRFKGETLGDGYADKAFQASCPGCSMTFGRNDLQLLKFRHDFYHLTEREYPMPGTIFDEDGKPTPPDVIERHDSLFPNELLVSSSADYKFNIGVRTALGQSKTLEIVRQGIETLLEDEAALKRARPATRGKKLLRIERVAIRRMMAQYWENHSPFALDLIGAVIRQGVFVRKMYDLDWLHSPAARSTMERLITKYDRFMGIMIAHPSNVCVPTLDVDLAWHTHQLNPSAYYNLTTTVTGKFIDHDDKIEETKLSNAFEWTCKTYQKMYKELYSDCTCWYCESLREYHAWYHSHKKFSPTPKEVERQLSLLQSANDGTGTPHGPHISAHNAIRPLTQGSTQYLREQTLQAQLEVKYQKACRKAKKAGRAPPERHRPSSSYYGTKSGRGGRRSNGERDDDDVFGGAPYCVEGRETGMYPADPSCANFVPGGAGNCCQGACGGGVAAGACAGDNVGSCAGGSVAGGCAGGSGAGGCGGGGSSGGGGGGGCGGGGGGGGGC